MTLFGLYTKRRRDGHSPPFQRGGCGINPISRSDRIAADGVVRSAKAFRPNDFAGLTTPSARTKVASRYFFDRASTPPFQEGNMLDRQFIHTFYESALLLESTKYARSQTAPTADSA